MFLIKMVNDDGDVFWKNHAYSKTWGSDLMAETFDNKRHAELEADQMPKGAGDTITVEEI